MGAEVGPASVPAGGRWKRSGNIIWAGVRLKVRTLVCTCTGLRSLSLDTLE